MRPLNWARRGTLSILLLALSCPHAYAAARYEVETLPSFFTGDFGSDIDTDILYFPLGFRVTSDRQDFRITAPFLHVRTDQPVVFVGGEVIPVGVGGETTQSGPGDVVLKEEVFFVVGDGSKRLSISGSVRVKLPTGDEEKGLGTGELDYGPGAGLIQPLGSRWNLLAEVLYVIRGDPEGIDLNNTFWYSAGLQARLSDVASTYLFCDVRESVIRDRESIRDLSLGYDHRISLSTKLRSTLYVGLSETAEDYGFTLGLSVSTGS